MTLKHAWITMCLSLSASNAFGESECFVSSDGSSRCSADLADADTSTTPSPFQCGIYMAPSTIPGAGLGMFTGIDRREGDIVGDGDLLLPIVDVWWHLQASKDYNGYDDAPDTLDPTGDYVWHGPELGMQLESSNAEEQVTAFAPGLDAAINCNLALINVDKDLPTYNTAGLHRSKDPGAGAITPYQNCSTTVSAPIPAGGELFKNYGDNWFLTREEVIGQVPFRQNFPRAEKLIKAFENKVNPRFFPSELRSDAYQIMKQFPIPSRTVIALPSNVSHTDIVVEDGIRSYYQQSAVKTIDELERTGRCVDTIFPGTSTINQAGRGAFAKKSFRLGEIITATPLLYTHSADFFKQYFGDWNDFDASVPDSRQFRSYALVMNYCWHHESASLYLCPYGYEVNYINHNQTQANIKMQWASNGMLGHRSDLLQSGPDEIGDKPAPGLIMEFVATRDIQKGEELFLDYGDAWEQAWKTHVRAFEQRKGKYAGYMSAREWNELNAHTILLTMAEQAASPYPTNMQLHCLDEGSSIVLDAELARNEWEIDNTGHPCQIASRKIDADGNVFYKVWYEAKEKDENGKDFILREWHAEDWLVREAIQMVDKPYTTDHWLEEAFRYPIGIPDEIFPDAWRGFGLEDTG